MQWGLIPTTDVHFPRGGGEETERGRGKSEVWGVDVGRAVYFCYITVTAIITGKTKGEGGATK